MGREKRGSPSKPAGAASPRGETASAIQLTDEQRLSWLQLVRSDNVGPATFRDLINHFRSAASALEALPGLIERGGVAGRIRIASRESAEREMDQALAGNACFIGMGEPDYPPALRAIDYPPPLICVKGNPGVLSQPAVAIVGSRNASINGMRMAARFAAELGQAEFAIVSGLARGIDAAAHKHSLATGTIAVFAGGVDRVFPEENQDLAMDILEQGGAFVSEMPLGWTPRSKDFPRRNRLIAGIARGLLVVEAAKRSGSLISARLANEAGRTVYAVPGSPLDPRCEGTNWLIKQGATLVTSPEDIIDDLADALPPSGSAFFMPEKEESGEAPPATNADDVREAIVAALGPAPIEIDDILRFTGATPGQVQLVLIELSLAGRIERHGGNRVSLI
ncbi:MAG: DNA-processing protein DprA [Nitratireductor sp.]|nr:DNA-processing protein DprA [Nitratireductor sp.]